MMYEQLWGGTNQPDSPSEAMFHKEDTFRTVDQIGGKGGCNPPYYYPFVFDHKDPFQTLFNIHHFIEINS